MFLEVMLLWFCYFFILFQYSFQVKCEAYVKKNAKPMSKGMRSRCQGECEADVKGNAKPMSRRARSRCQEDAHTRTRARRREVQTHTNKLTPNKGTIRCKVFGVILDSHLNDFGRHVGMMLVLLFILF